ncbi:hypothetical protein AVEN_133838-1 [Araneus ventricosus]|uniref:Uncharacterized protein n=1 Tax=Araneus ventricosus TaxID=182803 RepID=A0A4Y2I9A2_ARAVE|nr:hypothetical protein AVEN_133838-1 [Araneus ventricosus]
MMDMKDVMTAYKSKVQLPQKQTVKAVRNVGSDEIWTGIDGSRIGEENKSWTGRNVTWTRQTGTRDVIRKTEDRGSSERNEGSNLSWQRRDVSTCREKSRKLNIERALESGFGDIHLNQFYGTEQKARRQKPGESLHVLAAGVSEPTPNEPVLN